MDTDKILDKITNMVVEYGPKLIGAILVLIIGSWIIKIILKSFNKILDKQKIDVSLKPFLKSIFGILLRIMLIISVLGMVGIQMTSFIAILGAAGLAVGMALSGTLQNFAGGVMILLFKPFRVGDLLEAQGYKGIVHEIQIFNTVLKTPDNRTIIIPNGGLSNSSIKFLTSLISTWVIVWLKLAKLNVIPKKVPNSPKDSNKLGKIRHKLSTESHPKDIPKK